MPKKTIPPGQGPGSPSPAPGFRPGLPGAPRRKGFDPAAVRGPRRPGRDATVKRIPLPGKSRGR
jgi:hypothetical protein